MEDPLEVLISRFEAALWEYRRTTISAGAAHVMRPRPRISNPDKQRFLVRDSEMVAGRVVFTLGGMLREKGLVTVRLSFDPEWKDLLNAFLYAFGMAVIEDSREVHMKSVYLFGIEADCVLDTYPTVANALKWALRGEAYVPEQTNNVVRLEEWFARDVF